MMEGAAFIGALTGGVEVAQADEVSIEVRQRIELSNTLQDQALQDSLCNTTNPESGAEGTFGAFTLALSEACLLEKTQGERVTVDTRLRSLEQTLSYHLFVPLEMTIDAPIPDQLIGNVFGDKIADMQLRGEAVESETEHTRASLKKIGETQIRIPIGGEVLEDVVVGELTEGGTETPVIAFNITL